MAHVVDVAVNVLKVSTFGKEYTGLGCQRKMQFLTFSKSLLGLYNKYE